MILSEDLFKSSPHSKYLPHLLESIIKNKIKSLLIFYSLIKD